MNAFDADNPNFSILGELHEPLRPLRISYQDYHMLLRIVLRQALLSYQDYHMLSVSS